MTTEPSGEIPTEPTTSTEPPATEPTVDNPNPTEDKDNEGLLSALRKERDARKQHEKELKELRKFKDEQERLSLSEQERLQADLEEARTLAQSRETELNSMRLRSEFSEYALSQGMNPLVIEDVFAGQLSGGKIGINDEGVFGVTDAIDTLKSSKLLYFSAPKVSPSNINGGSGSGGTNSPDLNASEAIAAAWFKGAGVSTEDYVKNKNIV